MTVPCPHCATPTIDGTRCAVCGGSAGAPPGDLAGGESLVEKYSRQIATARRAWRSISSEPPAGAAVVEAGRDPVLEVRSPGVLNLLLLHAGYSPFSSLTFEGSCAPGAGGEELRIASRPAALRPAAQPVLAGGRLELPVPAPDYGFFFGLDEAVRGELEAAVVRGGRTLARRSLPVTVHTAGEWIHRSGCEPALAGAVTPNHPAVVEIVAGVRGDVLAYGPEDRARVEGELAALYDLVRRLELHYLGAPPSFEGSGQKVLFPDQVLACRRGCCLDLAVLEAALLERLGFHPLIVLLRDGDRRRGHACCGAWTSQIRARSPVLRDRDVLAEAIAGGDLLVWNPTQPFDGSGDTDFAGATAAGERLLDHFELALDVASCRRHRFKPVPRRGR